jgi:transposase
MKEKIGEKPLGAFTRAKNHLTTEQVKEKMKEAKDPRQLQRWQIIYVSLMEPRTAQEIAECVGVSKSLVQKMIPLYNKKGIHAIEMKSSGGRYHEYMSVEEENHFLTPFWERAERGELTTTKEIHQAYEEQIGKSVPPTTIYRLLDRHDWRKVMPRSFHPKSDIEAQEAFKKISQH